MEHYPVQNSEVFLLGSSHAPNVPPPSPPSPATPCERALSPPPEDLMSMTPPEIQDSCPSFSQRLSNAVHVLGTEATALSCLTRLYETEPVARGGFNSAVEAITRFRCDKGKLVICGIGKSGHIAKKLVATMNSLKIHAIYLHPTEALHGDLGGIGKYDTILLITFSGKTPELIQLLPHFDTSLPLIVMTSHTHPSTCAIIKQRPDAILLPAPIHKSETDSFGFNAPTTSTTMALALGDALAVVISNELHINVQAVFSQNHPGGAIGQAAKGPSKISDLYIRLSDLPSIDHAAITGANVLMSAYQSPSGWVRQGDDTVMSPRRIRRLQQDDFEEPAMCIQGLMVPRKEWIEIPSETSLPQAREWIKSMRSSTCDGETKYSDDAILVVMVDGDVSGVIEIGEVM
ncbi:SIS domain-containing protein [Mollisia scopiformis]|uniref:SIS domain-containing protein n=1 Tax=Mollisia scopiformis TaxID=149040 RepID=A0A194X7U2_MOLSC|nr:SIS domain-containing protein [Mollisia scopiformis]KUJ15882.1 SIS domain-containing protein [Mollisia scopiformis]